MTPEQQAELRAQARGNPAYANALAARDLDALAALLSVGRTRPSSLEVGNGTIIATIGFEAGNALLDHISSEPSMRYVKPLLDQGRLRVGSPVAQDAIMSFGSAGVISAQDADKLCALGLESDPVSRQDVAEALFNPDGTEK
jgi:hypothetical protein